MKKLLIIIPILILGLIAAFEIYEKIEARNHFYQEAYVTGQLKTLKGMFEVYKKKNYANTRKNIPGG